MVGVQFDERTWGKGRCVRGLYWLGGLGAGLVDVGVDGWTDGQMGG